MKKLLFSLAIFSLFQISGVLAQMTSQHDQKPGKSDNQESEMQAMLEKIKQTDYYINLQEVQRFVAGKKVLNSSAGNAGFILYLLDDSWAAAYREGDTIGSSFGNGQPATQIQALISSKKYGDASEPVPDNIIYANEYVNIELEVKKCHGVTINGLAFGFNTFNYTFENGRELDFKLVNDKNGVPAVRVFWEQW